MKKKNKINWVFTDGAPLILLARDYVEHWGGTVSLLTNTHQELLQYETDYDRACSISEYLGVLQIGLGRGLVLGDEPMQTAWFNSPIEHSDYCGGLVRWGYAPNEEVVLDVLSSNLSEIDANFPTLQFDVPKKSSVYLFDSSLPGNWMNNPDDNIVSNYVNVPLPGDGSFRVNTLEYKETDIFLVLHLFTRLAGPFK